MKRIIIFLILLLSITTQSQGQITNCPAKLSLGIEGFLGPSYRIELVPGTCSVKYLYNPETFVSSKGTTQKIIQIPTERWSIFAESLNRANVWSWKTNYNNPKVFDGTVWDVTIEWGNQKATARGKNAYPPQSEFVVFEKAIGILIGEDKMTEPAVAPDRR